VDAREQRGLVIADTCKITCKGSTWFVPSQSSGGNYAVRLSPERDTCTCPDYELREMKCKHIFAVLITRKRYMNRDGSTTTTQTVTVTETKRPTYKQDWPAYNAAQTREKGLFLKLLGELCDGIAWTPRPGRGRPTLPYDAAIFSAVYKVYSGFSGRRFQTDMNDARDAGLIHTAPHYNSISKTLEDPNTTKTLKELVIKSSLPLRIVETQFAVDSTGFSTNKFARWFDEKYGVEKKKAEWIKLHAMVGVQTNVVCACEISDQHDSPVYKQLVATTATNFRVDEISADKAYLSFENMELATELGAVPYIAFKTNSRGDRGPSIWQKMHAMFTLQRDEWLRKYHRRSNVESTFSAIKRKFGDAVRSKTDVACKNEVLAKVVAHNVVVCIHEMHELGIDVGFGSSDDGPETLRFPGAR
jgi:transposase